jgi:hypothetical protein
VTDARDHDRAVEPYLIALAMRAYPTEVRDRSGGEMLDTALDVSRGSAWRALREGLTLVRGGLKARANLAAEAGTRRLIANACAQGVTLWGLALLISALRFDRSLLTTPGVYWSGHGEIFFIAVQVLIACAVAAALIGNDRVSAVFGLAWVGISLYQYLAPNSRPSTLHWVLTVLVPLACYLVMLFAPCVRRRDPRRLLWLVAAVAFGLAPPIGFANFGYGLLGPEGFVLLVALVAGLFLLPVTSTLPLAIALALVAYGVSRWTIPGTEFADTGALAMRWAMTVVGPVLLVGGATLRLVRARRRVTS